MPMHDWTKVASGTYHAFHNAWITHLQEALNGGLLPEDYYALGEQRVGSFGPDLLALHVREESDAMTAAEREPQNNACVRSVATAPPEVSVVQTASGDVNFYLHRQRQLVIRHTSGDRIVAIMEIVSPANRHSAQTLNDFADKVVDCLQKEILVVIVDPFPPGVHDPKGIHNFIWRRLMAGDYDPPIEKALTQISYAASRPITAYIEPLAVGDVLADLPLFLRAEYYLPLPLEKTYRQAWSGIPARWQRVITGVE